MKAASHRERAQLERVRKSKESYAQRNLTITEREHQGKESKKNAESTTYSRE